MRRIQIIVLLLSLVSVCSAYADINSDLLIAATHGYTEIIQSLLQKGANANAKNFRGESALIIAAKYGYISTVDTLLEAGAEMNVKDSNTRTALIVAARNGHYSIIKKLLEAGAEVNVKDSNNKTALIVAVKNGHIHTIELLLEKGADANVKDKNGKTALIVAANYGHASIMWSLIIKGADVNARYSSLNTTALMLAAKKGYIAIVKVLLDNDADANAKDSYGQTALMYAAKHGFSNTTNFAGYSGHSGRSGRADFTSHIDILRTLVDGGTDVNVKDRDGWTALMRATVKGFSITVKTLLQKGADVNVENKFGKTALMYAKQKGYKKIVGLLQETRFVSVKNNDTNNAQKLSGNIKTGYGREKIFNAARYGRIKEVQALLDQGTDVNVQDENGGTVLMFAAHYGQKETVQLLIDQGANVNAKDKYGGSALNTAKNIGHDEIVRLLEKAREKNAKLNPIPSQVAQDVQGKDINTKDDIGLTPGISVGQKSSLEVGLSGGGGPGRHGGGISQTSPGKISQGPPVNISQDPMNVNRKDKISADPILPVKSTNMAIEKRLVDPELIAAAREGNTADVKNLLAKGADVKVRDEKMRETALIAAAKSGHTDIVKILLAKGADVNEKDVFGWTALMGAAENGHTGTVYALMVKGAKMKKKNNFGSTAFRLAAKNGHKKVVRLFKKIKKIIKRKREKRLKERQLAKSGNDNVASEPQQKSLKTPGTKWAVIIGISEYEDSQIPPLSYASDDARAFHNWAVSPDGGNYDPAQTVLLVDRDATENNIKQTLFMWLNQASENDLITIYFAGHGANESPEYPDNFFLFAYDTRHDRVASTGFPLWSIEVALERFIKARKVIFIVDASNPGGIRRNFEMVKDINKAENPINTGLQNLSKTSDKICVITASNNKQIPKRGKKWGGGVFTYFLLKGLKGEADSNMDERVTLGELIPFLSEQVGGETQNAQNPTVVGKYDPILSIEK